jgi:hypothetical protein
MICQERFLYVHENYNIFGKFLVCLENFLRRRTRSYISWAKELKEIYLRRSLQGNSNEYQSVYRFLCIKNIN